MLTATIIQDLKTVHHYLYISNIKYPELYDHKIKSCKYKRYT